MITYQPEDVTILIVDVADQVRKLFNEGSTRYAGDTEKSLRFVASATDAKGNSTQITFGKGESVTADEVLELLNQRGFYGVEDREIGS